VNRIEHGVRSIEDPVLVRRLATEGVTLDVCPISNVKLAVAGIPTMAAHPIRRLFDVFFMLYSRQLVLRYPS
jgi:adenosine deaminase